jgi:hypothetical protein
VREIAACPFSSICDSLSARIPQRRMFAMGETYFHSA